MMEAMLNQAKDHLKEGQSESARAWRERGIANFQIKKWNDAISDFSKARDLDPEDLESQVGLGMSLAMELKIYPAIEVLEALVEKHPGYVRGHMQLGFLYFRLCVIAKGRRHMEMALASRPPLAERRVIEEALGEQSKLDKKRFYRPDFEALKQQVRE